MSELAQRILEARSRIEPDFSFEREERVRLALGTGLKRQRQMRVGAVAVLGTLILLLGVFIGRQPVRAPVAQVAARQAVSLVELQDGSSVTARSTDARVETVEVLPHLVTLRLEAGAARFSVTPNPARPFRVLAGDVTITVLGTVFDVAVETSGVRVAVERGRVRVASNSTTKELAAGESVLMSSTTVAALAAELPSAATPLVTAPGEPVRAAPAVNHSWRALAEEGNYAAALTRLNAEGANAVRNLPEDLLLAADVARLGGRPERAVAPLQRILSNHAFDSRAPLAAFTLGRTLLEQLGRPREAAQAFSTARRLDRARALTQDALAREVESWSRAGEAVLARERALEYLKLYPNGRRAGAVKRLGGIE